jgi:hypothetical protein
MVGLAFLVGFEKQKGELVMRVIVIRQDEYDVLVVVRVPDGGDAETTFSRWANDPDVREHLDEDDLACAYWEELQVLELG